MESEPSVLWGTSITLPPTPQRPGSGGKEPAPPYSGNCSPWAADGPAAPESWRMCAGRDAGSCRLPEQEDRPRCQVYISACSRGSPMGSCLFLSSQQPVLYGRDRSCFVVSASASVARLPLQSPKGGSCSRRGASRPRGWMQDPQQPKWGFKGQEGAKGSKQPNPCRQRFLSGGSATPEGQHQKAECLSTGLCLLP